MIVLKDVLKVLTISLNEKENISQRGSGIGFRREGAESTSESACPQVWTGQKVHTQRCELVGTAHTLGSTHTHTGVERLGSAHIQV